MKKLSVVLLVLATFLLIIGTASGQEVDVSSHEEPFVPQWDEDWNGTTVIAGPDRYATAAQAAMTIGAKSSAYNLWIVNGEASPDALVVGTIANDLGDKILFVERDRVPEATAYALQQLSHAYLTFVGGDDVISPEVRAEVESLTCNYVQRDCR